MDALRVDCKARKTRGSGVLKAACVAVEPHLIFQHMLPVVAVRKIGSEGRNNFHWLKQTAMSTTRLVAEGG